MIMDADQRMLALLLVAPAVILPVHAVLSRRLRSASRQKTAAAAAVLGSLPASVLLWEGALKNYQGAGLATALVYCFLVYGTLAYCYFHFFNMSETARRIKIITEIHRGGSISEQDLMAKYRTTDVITTRLDRLVALNQLNYEDGYYSLKGRTLYWAGTAIFFWRRLLGMGNDEVGT